MTVSRIIFMNRGLNSVSSLEIEEVALLFSWLLNISEKIFLLPMTLLGFISCDEISCDVVEVVAMLLLEVYNFSFEIGDFFQNFLREAELRICVISLMSKR